MRIFVARGGRVLRRTEPEQGERCERGDGEAGFHILEIVWVGKEMRKREGLFVLSFGVRGESDCCGTGFRKRR